MSIYLYWAKYFPRRHLNCLWQLEFNYRLPTLVTNISRENKVLTSDPVWQHVTNIYFDFLFVCTGLKVNNQLVAYATRFLAVYVKKIMCSHTSTPQMPKDSVTDWLTDWLTSLVISYMQKVWDENYDSLLILCQQLQNAVFCWLC